MVWGGVSDRTPVVYILTVIWASETDRTSVTLSRLIHRVIPWTLPPLASSPRIPLTPLLHLPVKLRVADLSPLQDLPHLREVLLEAPERLLILHQSPHRDLYHRVLRYLPVCSLLFNQVQRLWGQPERRIFLIHVLTSSLASTHARHGIASRYSTSSPGSSSRTSVPISTTSLPAQAWGWSSRARNLSLLLLGVANFREHPFYEVGE